MTRPVRASLHPLVVLAVLAAALVLIGALQYRWVSRLSRIERERLEANLALDGGRFCDDVDREVSRAWEAFQVTPPRVEGELTEKLLASLARWRATAPYPALVSRIYLVRQLPRDELELGCLDEKNARFEACAMTGDLASIAELFGRKGKIRRLDPILPGLVVPVRNPPTPEERMEPGRPPPVRQHVVVRFDRAALSGELLPRIAAARFGSGAGAYSLEVAAEGHPGVTFFRSGPAPPRDAGRPDATLRLFLVRSFQDVRRDGAREPAPRDREPRADEERGGWVLTVRHPAGSLDAAVATARRRNLLLGGGVLALLAGAGVLLFVSTQRARNLAEQQLSFVAGISHELRTPLTVIRSAAQNLAADAITDREQVRRYGVMIEQEGRRLTGMIARVMAFARIRSGEQVYHLRPTALAPLLREIVEEFRAVLDERGIVLEMRVAEDLPPLLADAGALRHLFGNLLDNAIKYGGSGGRVEIVAERKETGGRECVEVRVSDRGKGIRRSDRKRIFDPFFRDADVSASSIPGSGLGLALVRHIVEAHGGRIRVESAVGLGSSFQVDLPAAPAGAASEERTS